MKLLLLLSACVALVAMASANNTYVAVVPRTIRPGIPTRVTVNILPLTSDVTVVTSLKARSSDVVLSSVSGTARSGEPADLILPVPSSLSSGQYVITLTGSGGVSFTNQTDVTFMRKSFSIFIQTDKAMYKPSQKGFVATEDHDPDNTVYWAVLFRAVAITPDMRPTSYPMDIEIYDPNSNKIKQWLRETDASGVVSLSLELADQPVEGDWRIKVTCQNAIEEKTFTVKEYVLPKFSVDVNIPSYMVNTEQSLSGTVKAEYTYGQPVRGVATVRLLRDDGHITTMVQRRFAINGEGSFVFSNTDVVRAISTTQGLQFVNDVKIRVEANVTETLTGKELSGDAVTTIVKYPAKLKFTDSSPKHMKPGMKYLGYLKVTQADGRPVVGVTGDVTLSGTYTQYVVSTTAAPTSTHASLTTPERATPIRPTHWYPWYRQTQRPTTSENLPAVVVYSVPQDGTVLIEIDVPINAESMTLIASYTEAANQTLSLKKMQSPSNSYLQLTPRGTQFRAGDTALIDVKSTIPITQFFYTVMSRGTIVASNVLVSSSVTSRTQFVLSIPLTPQMAPSAKVVAYYINSNAGHEIVSESVSFPVDGLFENQVSLNFNTARREPGEPVDLTVHADPQSQVNILTVDQSVLLLASGNDITAQQVLEEISSYDTLPTDQGSNRRWGWYSSSYAIDGDAAGDVFANAGVNVMTDAFLYYYEEPYSYPPDWWGENMRATFPSMAPQAVATSVPGHPGNLAQVGRVRNVFPETWLWTEATVGTNGSVTIQTTAPDTITSWVASAFAVNSATGLGVSPTTAKLEVFRPFFVSLNLPYSVIRGEEIVIQAIVFNYLTTDLQVVVTLTGGADFMSILVDDRGNMRPTSGDQVETIQVAAGEGKSVYFPIIPNGLGSVPIEVSAQSTMAADALRRQLLVEPEGDPREYSQSVLLDLTGPSIQTTPTTTFPISLPQGVVSGSERVTISAIGDLMGPTINNLDKLLKMPSGCGEQNMIGFAPDVYVLDYLTVTSQLTDEIRTKALSFLEKGYQRELTYQHTDGSFSAFGNRDPHGSTWLTSFVIRSFRQAKPYTFIDDAVLDKATTWLLRRQYTNGSFAELGHLHHRGMQGGVSSGATLSAYVLIALLEGNTNLSPAVRSVSQRTTLYLEGQLQQMTEPYPLALTTYALTLSGSSQASTAEAKLEALAIITAGMKHWESPTAPQPTGRIYWRRPNAGKALDIELAAYALLIYAHNRDFSGGLPITKWIVQQRNGQGGFVSTQDTVVGLQSMSQIGRAVYSDNFNVDVSVIAENSVHTFNISQENALVLQIEELSFMPSSVDVFATGRGMAMIGVTVNYNVESEPEEPSFELTTELLHETLNGLTVEVCTRWLHDDSSGMTVLEIGIPTAFAADEESIERPALLKRVEMASRKVVLYFDSVDGSRLCVSVAMERVGMAAKSQPVPVKIYDYYEPENQVTTFYQSQLLRDSSVCDVCGSDCGC